MKPLEELLARVEAATGPDREIEISIARQFDLLGHAADMPDGFFLSGFAPISRTTESIDAAVALVEKMLPGWKWVMHSPRSGLEFGASLSERKQGGKVLVGESKANAPLALLAAFLRALPASPVHPQGS